MSVTKPLILDETGKAIVNALLQNDIVTQKTQEISDASDAKLAEVLDSIPDDYTELQEEVDEIKDTMYHSISSAEEFEQSITTEETSYSRLSDNITINEPISIPSKQICVHKTYIGGTFYLNDNMFTWDDVSAYHSIPNFIGCVFVGNGNNICDEGCYPTNGKFTNCIFLDCGLVKSGHFAQSQKFVNCRFVMNTGHTFIEANQVYDTRFIGCQLESDNKAPMIHAIGTNPSMNTVSEVSFTDCIMESQTTEIVMMHDGQIKFTNCYTEATKELVIVNQTNFPSNGLLSICCCGCRIQPSADKYAFNIDQSFNGSIRSFVDIRDCWLNVGKLINRNDFFKYNAENIVCVSGASYLPSNELSKIGSNAKNSIVEFDTSNPSILHVKKTPCLITYNSSVGGWHTELCFVGNANGSHPTAINITNPSKEMTAEIDPDTGYVTVTLNPVKSSADDLSAVYLTGIVNQLNLTDYWRSTNGYNV